MLLKIVLFLSHLQPSLPLPTASEFLLGCSLSENVGKESSAFCRERTPLLLEIQVVALLSKKKDSD